MNRLKIVLWFAYENAYLFNRPKGSAAKSSGKWRANNKGKLF